MKYYGKVEEDDFFQVCNFYSTIHFKKTISCFYVGYLEIFVKNALLSRHFESLLIKLVKQYKMYRVSQNALGIVNGR